MVLQLRYASHSEIGLIRKNNQDSGYASPHLLVVADGMGGAAAGDLASAVAIDTIRRLENGVDGDQMLEALAGVIDQANERISDLVHADNSLDGMGTTVTGAMFDGVELALVHIGDSRAYLMRDGQLEQLTHDHSWVQSLVDEGKISAAEATYHPHRSLLLKVLNGQPANDPDLAMVQVRAGDRLMFCSDGVCGLVEDDEIAEALALPEIEEALGQLVAVSLAEGGVDNITVIVADVVESGGMTDEVVLGAAAERDIPTPQALAAAVAAEAGDDDDEDDDTVVRRMAPAVTEPEAADEERYTPQAPHRRRLARPLVGLLVLVLVLGAGLGTAYAWTRTQYYVGAAGEQVAIYQGLSDGLPGIRLSKVFEVQPDLAVSALPPYYQERVRANIDVSSLGAARETVYELKEAAARCAGKPGTGEPSSSPTPSPEPTGKPSGKPSPTASTTPTSTPSGSVDPGC